MGIPKRQGECALRRTIFEAFEIAVQAKISCFTEARKAVLGAVEILGTLHMPNHFFDLLSNCLIHGLHLIIAFFCFRMRGVRANLRTWPKFKECKVYLNLESRLESKPSQKLFQQKTSASTLDRGLLVFWVSRLPLGTAEGNAKKMAQESDDDDRGKGGFPYKIVGSALHPSSHPCSSPRHNCRFSLRQMAWISHLKFVFIKIRNAWCLIPCHMKTVKGIPGIRPGNSEQGGLRR